MKIYLFTALLLLLTNFSGIAQSARLDGTVKDRASAESLTGATIKVVETGTVTFTDFDGNFSFPELTPGVYTIAVNLISYNTVKFFKVNVGTSEINNMNITLEKSDVSLPNNQYMTADADNLNPNTGLGTL
jgi:hypothetical protein